MKRFSFIIVLAIVALIAPQLFAAGQDYQTATLNIGTNATYLAPVVAAADSNTTQAVYIDCSGNAKVSLQTRTKLSDTGAVAVVYSYVKTLDGTYFTSDTGSFTVTPNGTNIVTTINTITTTGLKGLKITTITNPNTVGNLTNLSATVGYKQADN